MYVKVILPINLQPLSYKLPDNLRDEVTIGSRVAVRLGKSKIYCGVVCDISDITPDVETRFIEGLIDKNPIVNRIQFDLWEWISAYYICTLGEVAMFFMPSMFNLNGMSFEDAAINLPWVKQSSTYILSEQFIQEDNLRSLLNSLKRSKAKINIVTAIYEALVVVKEPYITIKWLKEQGASAATIKWLFDSEFIVEGEKQFLELLDLPKIQVIRPELSKEEEDVINKIDIENPNRVVLHTPHGDDQIRIIAECASLVLDKNKEVLIVASDNNSALSIYTRLNKYFENGIMLFTSSNNGSARGKIYASLLKNPSAKIIISTKSGIGIPFSNLGLIVVINENDAAHNNSEYSPFISSRDCAVYLAMLHKAPIILSTDTPSIESMYNCNKGKYKYIQYIDSSRNYNPKITIIEKRTIAVKERQEKGYNSSETRYFSKLLLSKIEDSLSRKEQVLIYQPRRGYSTSLVCQDCGEYVKCHNCNVSLTYHKDRDSLECHWCSSKYSFVTQCPSCGSKNMTLYGVGTENVQEKIASYFPKATVLRLDSDTLTSAKKITEMRSLIDSDKCDIIVGAGSIFKMSSYNNVTLATIINGDNMISFADYRTNERAFATVAQLANTVSNGELIIQMNNRSELAECFRKLDYGALYLKEIDNREKFKYPPFYTLITITMSHKDEKLVEVAAEDFTSKLITIFGSRVLGPDTPPVNKIRGRYLMLSIIKLEKGADYKKAASMINGLMVNAKLDLCYRGILFSVKIV